MSKAYRLRVDEVRAAYRLLGECRDLGSDPELWQTRMCAGLSRLFGDGRVTGGEGRPSGTNGAISPLSFHAAGLDDAELRNYLAYMRAGGPALDPFVWALPRARVTAVACTRSEVVADRAYYRAPVFDRFLQPFNVHHRLASILFTTGGTAISLLHLHRYRGERDFSSRDRALLELFHQELGPLVGRALVSATEPTPAALPRRLRQTLACLVEGDSEKQVAARLGLSTTTVHQYVSALYRRFRVTSRGQLLAHVVKRSGRPEWRGLVVV